MICKTYVPRNDDNIRMLAAAWPLRTDCRPIRPSIPPPCEMERARVIERDSRGPDFELAGVAPGFLDTCSPCSSHV